MFGRKIASIVCSAAVGVQALLFTEYNLPGQDEEPHIFVPIQTAFREFVNQQFYGKPKNDNDNNQDNTK